MTKKAYVYAAGTLDGCFTSIADEPYIAGTLTTIVALLQTGKCNDEYSHTSTMQRSFSHALHAHLSASSVQTIPNLTPFPEQFKPFLPTLQV